MRRSAGLVAIAAAALAGGALADLPPDGWPQPRRDARLTARADGDAPRTPAIAWTREVGEALVGEPAAVGCTIVVANGSGEVAAVNARGGSPLWRSSTPRGTCGAPAIAPSSVAIDSSGLVVAGLGSDVAVLAAIDTLCRTIWACGSYRIDNGESPPGLDVVAELVPSYVDSLVNPCTGAPAVHSDVPSPGDLRYVRTSPSTFHLGMWWTDGGLLEVPTACASGLGTGDLDPTWPRSRDVSGRGAAFDIADGAPRWLTDLDDLAGATTPIVVPGGFVFAQEGVAAAGPWSLARGRVAATTIGGTTTWDWRRAAGCRGAVARDAVTGDLYVSQAFADLGTFFNITVTTLATAAESWSIDAGAYPPTGELAPLLVPTYVGAMPVNAFTGAPIRWSPSPSQGDYDYVAWNADTEYRLCVWNDLDECVAVFETGAFVREATDRFAAVTRLSSSGAVLRTTRVSRTATVTPLLLADDGSVVIGESDGDVLALDPADLSERWRVPTGEPLRRAPVLLPGSVFAFPTDAGRVVAVDRSGVRWRYDLGCLATSDASATRDGITLVGDERGVLHAIEADGSAAWTLPVGGASSVALTTTPVLHDGLVLVGRADGALVAVAEAPASWLPPWPGGVLKAWRTSSRDEARLEWTSIALPDVPGAHYHLRRMIGSPQAPGLHVLPHDAVATEAVDATPGLPLVFYELAVSDCGENEAR